MRIYIAGPFFNPAQVRIINVIERACDEANIDYYSPRLHSGSHRIPPEKRSEFDVWKPILMNNIGELHGADLLICVLEYAFAKDVALVPAIREGDGWKVPPNAKPVELPDLGTIFETGYSYRHGVPVVGYHTTKQPTELNLMLSHTLNGFVSGEANLRRWLTSGAKLPDDRYVHQFRGAVE